MRFLILLGLFATSLVSWAAPTTLEKLEASVNSNIILLSDVSKFRQTLKLRAQLDPLFTGTKVAAAGAGAPANDIVEFLIDEKLIAQQYPATDAEVEQEVNSIQAANHIDRNSLRHALSEQGFIFEQYFELIRISLSKRSLIDRDIRTKVTISDDDIKNYYYNHYAKTSSVPKAFHLQMISISLKNYKSSTAAHDVAQNALKAIRAGESFDEVARRTSDDSSASNGGDMGTLGEDQIAPIMSAQAKKLKVGQVSEVFGGGGQDSFYILKLTDIKSSDTEHYEKMKEEIRNQLVSTEYQHQIALWLERQRQTAFIHHAGDPSIVATSNSPAAAGTPPAVPAK